MKSYMLFFELLIVTLVIGIQVKSLHEPMLKSLQVELNSTPLQVQLNSTPPKSLQVQLNSTHLSKLRDAPPAAAYTIMDGCGSDLASECALNSASATVRCCTHDGTGCDSDPSGTCLPSNVSFVEARQACNDVGMRLCSIAELQSSVCCNTGCQYNNVLIWTMDSCEQGIYYVAPWGESCSPGTMVSTEADCRLAGPEIGYQWTQSVTLTDRPGGCFRDVAGGHGLSYFNTILTASRGLWGGVAGICRAATCDDGLHNGDEEGVDCGGSCSNSCVLECWTAGGCTDDGLEFCDWCGMDNNGYPQACCSSLDFYQEGSNCYLNEDLLGFPNGSHFCASTVQVCDRPNAGCYAGHDIFAHVDCDGDGILDLACSTTINENRWLILSSEGCPNSWGSSARSIADCPEAFQPGGIEWQVLENMVVYDDGHMVYKNSGSMNSYDAYATFGPAYGISGRPTTTSVGSHICFGLSTTATPQRPGGDYSIGLFGGRIYDHLQGLGHVGNYTVDSVISVLLEDDNVNIYHDGSLVSTMSTSVQPPLYATVSIYERTDALTDIEISTAPAETPQTSCETVLIGSSPESQQTVVLPHGVSMCDPEPRNEQAPHWADTFSVSVADGFVTVTRTDQDGVGWGQPLEITCCSACETVLIGSSQESQLTVELPHGRTMCDPEPRNEQAPHWTDTFSISVADGSVTVTRTDQDGVGWGQPLEITCCSALAIHNYCVVTPSRVISAHATANEAKEQLNSLEFSSNDLRMVCEIISGETQDPHYIRDINGVPQSDGAPTWNKLWRDWDAIHAMNNVCRLDPICSPEFTLSTHSSCSTNAVWQLDHSNPRGYANIGEAVVACEADLLCGGIQDRDCNGQPDGDDFLLCPVMDEWNDSSSSCVYEKPQQQQQSNIQTQVLQQQQ